MVSSDDMGGRRGDQLAWAIKIACLRSQRARVSARRTIRAVASTEQDAAAALDRLAELHPHRAKRLTALSETARRQAALAWHRGVAG